MNSIILQLAARYIKALLMLFAVIALLRGHNHPGGGFIGGLLAALAIIYYSFAFGWQKTILNLRILPTTYISWGLGMVSLSFVPALLMQQPALKGHWVSIPLGIAGTLKLGTPLVFDIGVFMAVIGVTLLFFFTLIKNR
ncbi:MULTISPECIES: MnhB domain-containing protein [unclassified Carboxylicivirga]|uniref:MnhB domain-containing protein n=1 Tax=Carboxylicivirga TaxID=1628153 RepID=UPI003D35502E